MFVPAGTTKSSLLELARQIHERCGLAVPEAMLPPRTLARVKREGSLPWADLVRPLRRLPVADTVDLLEEACDANASRCCWKRLRYRRARPSCLPSSSTAPR